MLNFFALVLCGTVLYRTAVAGTDKTLVSWVSLANTTQQGGSILTIPDGDRFHDAIVFGERASGKWMAGSDSFHRTQADQDANAVDTAGPDALVRDRDRV